MKQEQPRRRNKKAPRQLEALSLLRDGLTINQIAERMSIEPESVEMHLYLYCKKHGCTRQGAINNLDQMGRTG